jgi:hypothetical protein
MIRAKFPMWVAATVAIAAAAAFEVSCGGSQTQSTTPKPDVEEVKKPSPSEQESSSSVSLPGACVDPIVDGDKHDGTRPFDKHVQDDNDFSSDLDDDGTPDQAIEPGWSCGETCNRSLYVMRKGCGVYVGTIGSRHRYDVRDDKHHGLHDISAYPATYEADDSKRCWEVVWEFDGSQYKRTKRRECDCAMTATTKRCAKDWDEIE